MSDINEILGALPIEALAAQTGATPDQVTRAATQALPALFGGLEANAQDERGAASITEAVAQHDASVLDGGVDVNSIDTADGEKITQHIFGDNKDAVVQQLGGGLPEGLVRKLLPILAPIALSYLAKKMGGGSAHPGNAANEQGGMGGGLGDILGQVLGGGSGSQSGGLGGGLGDILGGLLGGGRR